MKAAPEEMTGVTFEVVTSVSVNDYRLTNQFPPVWFVDNNFFVAAAVGLSVTFVLHNHIHRVFYSLANKTDHRHRIAKQ